jgi:heme exporter protein CcmD
MNHWPFVVAAYAIAVAATAGLLLLSYLAMRRAEARAESLKRP